MNVTAKHIASQKRIGSLDGRPVVEVMTTGGLYMVVVNKSGRLETLGTGSHRAVARFIAEKREPGLRITELSKSDFLEQAQIDSVLTKYEALTDLINSVE